MASYVDDLSVLTPSSSGLCVRLQSYSKNTVYQYSEVEKKVREATNNDKWGVSTSAMSDLARATNNYEEYPELFAMLWKRLNDLDHVMHVQKALILTDYLLRNGSERFISDAKRRSRDIGQLTKYKHYDEYNRDDAGECRTKAKQVYDLLMDDNKLSEERSKAHAIKDVKLSGYGAHGYSNGGGSSYQSESRGDDRPRSRRNSDDRGDVRSERRAAPSARSQDDSSRPSSGASSARTKAPAEENAAKSGAAPTHSATAGAGAGADKPKRKKKAAAAAATSNGGQSSSGAADPFATDDVFSNGNGFASDPFDVPTSISFSSSSADPFGAPAPFAATAAPSSSAASAPAPSVTRQLSSKPASSSSSVANPALASAVPAAKSRKGRKKDSEVQTQPAAPANESPVFDRQVSYDLSAYSTATPRTGNQNIDILTGNELGSIGSGSGGGDNLESIFAATSFGEPGRSNFAASFAEGTDGDDVFGSNSAGGHTNGDSKTNSNSASAASSAHEEKSSRAADVWAIGSEFTNIDSIDKPADRKKNSSKEEVSMAMMRSMQPLGTPATAADGPNAGKRSNIAPPQQIANSGMGVGGGMPFAGAGAPFNPYAVVPYGQAAPMLALMPPGMTGGMPVLMYPGVGAAPFPHQGGMQQQNGFGQGELPFAAAPQRKQPTSGGVGPTGKAVIFEAVPEARPATAAPAPVSTKPTGPRW